MKYIKKRANFVKGIYKEKCPNCGEGHVFEKSAGVFRMPLMNVRCSECDYRFEREPGYFIGAMYLSYGLAIAQGVLAFLLSSFLLPEITIEWVIVIVTFPMLLMAKKNFKWSRILYIHIFPW
ncbi:MAG: hypothetical protein ACI865_003116 [Flavobacteriaceae bacterium]|jgi:uncharacterized protein (DUF983 family)